MKTVSSNAIVTLTSPVSYSAYRQVPLKYNANRFLCPCPLESLGRKLSSFELQGQLGKN
jgi:hypothetical protein